jgi:hypothetical protein
MSDEIIEKLGEIGDRIDAIAARLEDGKTEQLLDLVKDVHSVWCLEVEHERRVMSEAPQVAVRPGSRVSWTDPKDGSNVAWGGTVEFVGLDKAGNPIAHVDFAGYGRRNLPVDQLIVEIVP